MKVIRKRLDEQQTLPEYLRWSDICLCVEITFDGGVTWIESPENDPRYNPALLAPALTGEDAQCDAAARMVGMIRAQVDAAIDAANAVGLASVLIALVVAVIPIVNVIVNVFLAVANALVVLGSLAISESFDEEAYDHLLCVFYDNIGEDGQVSQEELDSIIDEIETDFPPTGAVIPVMQLLVQTLGTVGFSNAGALRTESGDCDDCIGCDPATCTEFDFDISDQGFVTHTWSGGDFQGGVYWTSGGGFPDGWLAQTQGGFNKIGLESHCDCIRADKVKVTTFGAAGGNAQLSIRISKHSDNTQLALKNFYINPTGAGSAVSESTWDIGGFVNEEDVDIEIGVKTTAGYGFMVTKLELIET